MGGLADGALVPGVRGVAGEVGVVGLLVSPGVLGLTLGLGELPGALVCASTGATLTTRASSTVNAMWQDLIWTLLARYSARGFAIEVPSSARHEACRAEIFKETARRTAARRTRNAETSLGHARGGDGTDPSVIKQGA
jgi:hypothetical protein